MAFDFLDTEDRELRPCIYTGAAARGCNYGCSLQIHHPNVQEVKEQGPEKAVYVAKAGVAKVDVAKADVAKVDVAKAEIKRGVEKIKMIFIVQSSTEYV